MDKSTKLKWSGIIIGIVWIILFSGLVEVPIYLWVFMAAATLVYYMVWTSGSFRKKGSLDDVIDDMEEYMEKKAENTEIEELKADETEKVQKEKDESEKEDEYDFGDDIKIIKK